MKNYVLFLVSILCTSCLVSRMARPIITGWVLDYQENPIEKCQVGEVFTDKKGYFRLPEKRYHEFTFIGFEAPPVYVSEEVKKEGYEPDVIVYDESLWRGKSQGNPLACKRYLSKAYRRKNNLKRNIRQYRERGHLYKRGATYGFSLYRYKRYSRYTQGK